MQTVLNDCLTAERYSYVRSARREGGMARLSPVRVRP